MAIRALFPTLLYRGALIKAGGVRFNNTLLDECQALAASDEAGRRWSAKSYLGGYTSYGSLDRLHLVSSLFAGLARRLDPHVKAFAHRLQVDLRGRTLAITDCWVNVMPAGVVHSLHLHPTSFISGTYYVQVPKGAGALKFEDPRLSRMMAAPPRQTFVSVPARAGELILFESWLRHEVPPARYAGERISISFNYGWSARRGGAR
ncbi:MAG TPA: TIGR02466 family protein [Reyranella sp.]|nr:TIGR02466 family protein [Reyranella sp.]